MKWVWNYGLHGCDYDLFRKHSKSSTHRTPGHPAKGLTAIQLDDRCTNQKWELPKKLPFCDWAFDRLHIIHPEKSFRLWNLPPCVGVSSYACEVGPRQNHGSCSLKGCPAHCYYIQGCKKYSKFDHFDIYIVEICSIISLVFFLS